MYDIVAFYPNTEVEVIPELWLSDSDTTCEWPPKNVNHATESREHPRADWTTYVVRLLKKGISNLI